jgi:hypothetical protein
MLQENDEFLDPFIRAGTFKKCFRETGDGWLPHRRHTSLQTLSALHPALAVMPSRACGARSGDGSGSTKNGELSPLKT